MRLPPRGKTPKWSPKRARSHAPHSFPFKCYNTGIRLIEPAAGFEGTALLPLPQQQQQQVQAQEEGQQQQQQQQQEQVQAQEEGQQPITK